MFKQENTTNQEELNFKKHSTQFNINEILVHRHVSKTIDSFL